MTAKTILIGGTFPFTGVAAAYSAIPKAERAYFLYVTAHGGVNGRRIQFTYYDDAYDPSKTVPLTQKLVEQDQVFADYGTAAASSSAPTAATTSTKPSSPSPAASSAVGSWRPHSVRTSKASRSSAR